MEGKPMTTILCILGFLAMCALLGMAFAFVCVVLEDAEDNGP